MNNHVQFGFTFEHFSNSGGGHLGFLIGIKNLNFVEDLPVINGSLIRRKQKTTPTNDKMTAAVPTFLCIFLLHHLQTKDYQLVV